MSCQSKMKISIPLDFTNTESFERVQGQSGWVHRSITTPWVGISLPPQASSCGLEVCRDSWFTFIHGPASLYAQNKILLLFASGTLKIMIAAKCHLPEFCTDLCMKISVCWKETEVKMLKLVWGIWVQTSVIIAALKLFHKTVLSLIWPRFQNSLVISILCNSVSWIKAVILFAVLQFENILICWIIPWS